MKPSLRTAVFERDDYTCQYCGARPRLLTLYRAGKKHTTLHVDHMIPRVRGGKDDIKNLVTACRGCNMAKKDRRWPFPLAYCAVCGEPDREAKIDGFEEMGYPIHTHEACYQRLFVEYPTCDVDDITLEVAAWDRLLEQEELGVA